MFFIPVQIKEFVEDISVKYNEMMPLTYLWECCLLSVWFCDQTTALELLEKNNKLRDYLAPKYPYVIAKALKNNQIDIVQRLLQLFLTHKMERQYISLIQQFFDYHCKYYSIETSTQSTNLLSMPGRT